MGISLEITMGEQPGDYYGDQPGDYYGESAWRLLCLLLVHILELEPMDILCLLLVHTLGLEPMDILCLLLVHTLGLEPMDIICLLLVHGMSPGQRQMLLGKRTTQVYKELESGTVPTTKMQLLGTRGTALVFYKPA